eukprot:365986-Chlamydomonas_euryale.AAC.5
MSPSLLITIPNMYDAHACAVLTQIPATSKKSWERKKIPTNTIVCQCFSCIFRVIDATTAEAASQHRIHCRSQKC